MRKLPNAAVPFILIIASLLLGYLAWQLRQGTLIPTDSQRLDELNIQTDNPQPAGRNLAP